MSLDPDDDGEITGAGSHKPRETPEGSRVREAGKTSHGDEGIHGETRRPSPLMEATWEAATTDPDPLAALGATRALLELLSTWEYQLVAEAIEGGATWESIGGSVGVSRQAAWERFHGEVHDFRRQVRDDIRAMRERHRREVDELKRSVRSSAQRRRRPS